MIKLRAWWMEQEVMCDVDVIGFSEGAITVSNENTTYEHLGLNEVELMQCTGIKDAKGVEIYEGDIVEAPWSKAKYLVDYVEGRFVGRIKYREYTTLYKALKVIGNIYEHPELLEVAE